MALEDFDELFVGNPSDIERNLRTLLPAAQSSPNRSLYPQILSQIALAQAMQKNFTEAYQTLDDAEKVRQADDHLTEARVLLERGRVLMQANDNTAAVPLFMASYDLCLKHRFDFHACNAAHMMAMIVESVQDKIQWNAVAIELAETSPLAEKWLGSLYNNLGHALIEAERFDEALHALKRALSIRKQEGFAFNVRVAQWAVARALRFLNRDDDALSILNDLVAEYDHMIHSGTLDLPMQALISVRGLVYEELAEIYAIKQNLGQCREFAKLACDNLAQDEWFVRLYPKRLERLQELKKEANES